MASTLRDWQLDDVYDPTWSDNLDRSVDELISIQDLDDVAMFLEQHSQIVSQACLLLLEERMLSAENDADFTHLSELAGIIAFALQGDHIKGILAARDPDLARAMLLDYLNAGDQFGCVGVCWAGIRAFEKDSLLGPLTSLILVMAQSAQADQIAEPTSLLFSTLEAKRGTENIGQRTTLAQAFESYCMLGIGIRRELLVPAVAALSGPASEG